MTTATATGFQAIEPFLVAYYSLFLMISGTSLNILTFIIFCRAKFRKGDERPTIHYMRAIAIVDIMMLYGWNFDHYLANIYGFYVKGLTIGSCKFIIFLNYFAPQVSAWLRVFICLDRYLSLSRLHRTWFSRSKSALIIIAIIMIFFFLFNGHIFISACHYKPNGIITGNTDTFKIFPLWDWVNLGMYNGLPFICMTILNSGVIYHLIRLKKTSTVQNSGIRHRSISITLVITTILFMILTIPPTICYGFFYSDVNLMVLHLLDALMYTYHVIAFPLYLMTFNEFRREFVNMVLCRSGKVEVAVTFGSTRITKN